MRIEVFVLFWSVAGAHFLALLSPGVDFVLIVKSGLAKPLSRAFGVAVGIAAANGVYIVACLAGIASVIAASPALMGGIQAAGGAYLLFLGIDALRTRRTADDISGFEPSDSGSAVAAKAKLVSGSGDGYGLSFAGEFCTGFGSSILNPKLPLFYLGLFSLLANSGTSFALCAILGVWMTSVVLAWDSFVLFMLTRARLRSAFLGRVRLIDIVSGILLSLIGLRFLVLGLYGFIR